MEHALKINDYICTCSNAKADFAELVHADCVALEVVAERAVLVEGSHQPEFHLQILPSLIYA